MKQERLQRAPASLGLNTLVQSHTVPRDLRCLASCACTYHVVGIDASAPSVSSLVTLENTHKR